MEDNMKKVIQRKRMSTHEKLEKARQEVRELEALARKEASEVLDRNRKEISEFLRREKFDQIPVATWEAANRELHRILGKIPG